MRKVAGIAEAAGKQALTLQQSLDDLRIETKGPGDFVTEADHRIQHGIEAELKSAFGDQRFLGEEGGGGPITDGWVVDPIDGTSNFLRKLPLWGVSIAWMEQGEPVVGAVAMPALDEVVCAAKGAGLYLNGERVDRHLSFDQVGTVAIGENKTWSHVESESVAAGHRSRGCDVLRFRCASVSLAFTALGRLDGYAERYVHLWDIAAGWILCAEAGIVVQATIDSTNTYCGICVQYVQGI